MIVSLSAHALAISAYASWRMAPTSGGAVVLAVCASRELSYDERADTFEPAQFADELTPSALEDAPLEEARVVELEPAVSEAPRLEPVLVDPFDARLAHVPLRFESRTWPRATANSPAAAVELAVVEAPARVVAPPAALETSAQPTFVAARALNERNSPPVYPRVARQRGWQGVSVLEVRVDVDGRVLELRVVESSGFAALDRAALDAVRDWRFEPARQGGLAIESRVEVPIVWRLAKS